MAVGDPNFGTFKEDSTKVDNLRNFFSSNTFNFEKLEYSGTEIDKVSSVFNPRKRNSLTREMASEDLIKKQNLKDYKIIHFATHSLIDNKKPLRSSILLTLDDDPAEDGFLQMREIYNLSLNSDLVTLSSCQTGLGQLINGEGIEGINRAFFYAGASSVLMSLWPVNDQATSQLMERFYFHLRSNKSIANALRQAKLELASSDVLSHPFYWAGFVISGDVDTKIFAKTSGNLPLYGISFLLLGGIVFFSVRRYRNHRNNHN
jgi:CHAT domain-containing protein